MSLAIIILSGGGGLRLWPSSRENIPKQFLKITNSLSTFQISILRALKLKEKIDSKNEKIFIITNIKYRFISENQIKEIKIDLKNIIFIFEPVSKNTLPSAIIVCLIAQQYKFDNVIIFCSDHYIANEDLLINYIIFLNDFIKKGYLGIFGIKPTSFNSGYGYIEIDKINIINDHIYKVKKFIEKPDYKMASSYFNNENYLWNSGIFILNINTFLEECQKLEKNIFNSCFEIFKEAKISNIQINIILGESFNNIIAKSIDCGIIEKSDKIITYFCDDIGWMDIGDWNSHFKYHKPDKNQNDEENFKFSLNENIIEYENTNCHIQNNHSSLLVSTVNLQNINVIVEQDAILIINKSYSQKVKELVEKMKTLKIAQANTCTSQFNLWGKITNMLETKSYKINEIIILPNQTFVLNDRNFDYCKIISGKGNEIIGKKKFKISNKLFIFKNNNKVHQVINSSDNEYLFLVELQLQKI